MWLINVLIFLFAGLICYQIIQRRSVLREGLDTSGNYQDYDMSTNNIDPTALSQQNAGNIQFLKSQVDDISGLKDEVTDLSGNLATLSDQVQQLIKTQSDYASNSLPSTAPEITGAT
jgi:uncharacterized protein YydD (DUF2326 family)